MAGNKYVSALSLRWLTPFYDALVEAPMSALRMREELLAQFGNLEGKKLLDVGCGTGTFANMVKRTFPAAEVTGLDGDPQILEIARSKAARLRLNIRFSEAMSYSMPYPDGTYEAVTTSLMLHHLSRQDKEATAREMFRVLKPGGTLAGMDFAEPRGPIGRGLRPMLRHFERVGDNLYGFLPDMFAAAGFRGYLEIRRYILGSVMLFRASKPS